MSSSRPSRTTRRAASDRSRPRTTRPTTSSSRRPVTPRTIAPADRTPVRTLTERELNRALLARQLLLDRAELPIGRAIEKVGGLQTQYAPSGYIGLWTRVARVERDDLTRALEQRRVIQGTLMRATIHIVSRRDYGLLAAGIRHDRLAHWRKVHRNHPAARSLPSAVRKVRGYLSDGPKKRTEIQRRVGLRRPAVRRGGPR